MKKLLSVLALLAVAVFVAGCGQAASGPSSSGSGVGETVRTAGGTFTRVSPEELKRASETQALVLVNTHVPYAGDLPGTDLSIPYTEIGNSRSKLPGKNKRIVLYCQGGPMSDKAARTLVELGYTNVWDLRGGMDAWQKAGFGLEGV